MLFAKTRQWGSRCDISSESPCTSDYTRHHERATAIPSIPLLRFCDGGLRLCPAVFESERTGEGNFDRGADIRHRYLSRRSAVFPHLLHLWRHIDRSVWIWARPPRRVGGIWVAGLCLPHGGGGRSLAAVGNVARHPSVGGSGLRQYTANRGGVDHRISLRNLREQLRAREDEDMDSRTLAVDPHRRLDPVRRAGGLDTFLFHRLLWPHADVASHRRPVHPIPAQERLGNHRDAGHLSHRVVLEKS